MQKDVTLSTRITGDLAAKVDLLAEQYNRSRSSLLHEALTHFVENELQFIAAVQEGLDAAERGDVVEHEAVVAELERDRKQFTCD